MNHKPAATNLQPPLRLVHPSESRAARKHVTTPTNRPALAADDPRWVLAVRTADALEGSILPPVHRQSLVRFGRSFGLTDFDINLIIAIIQDQARRGHLPTYCPRHAEAQLAMVPVPLRHRLLDSLRGRAGLTTALILTAILALELALAAAMIN